MKAKVLRAYMLVALGLSIFFLLSLSLFETLPMTTGNNDLIITQQANFQLARLEFLLKDVYILAYRGDGAAAQAVGELQSQLPIFEQVQAGLLNGDASLGLPPNPSAGVKQALLASQPDYLAIVTAIKTILKTPDVPADPVQVTIVAQRDRSYITTMYPIVILLQQEAQTRLVNLLLIKLGLILLSIMIIVLKYFLFTQRVVEKMIEEERLPRVMLEGGISP